MEPAISNHLQSLHSISAQLDRIEHEMRRIGYWTENPPDLLAQYDAGKLRGYLDAPTFELWLQCVFIPRARQAVQTDSLPGQSQVGLMAMRQYDYQSLVPEALPLLHLLRQFDKLVEDTSKSNIRNAK